VYETFVAVDVGHNRGPAINKTTTATIAHVAQRGMFGFSVSLLTFEFLRVFFGDFLFKKFAGFLRAAGLRFDDEGFAGGGGGGSLVTRLMIRPDVETLQWRMSRSRQGIRPT
jgi:hypothetical protein